MNSLPAGFETLMPFVDAWAVATMPARARLRDESTPEARTAFYDAVKPLAPAALDYLDSKPRERFGEPDATLMNLLLSFAHVALAIEIQADADAVLALSRKEMRITREPV